MKKLLVSIIFPKKVRIIKQLLEVYTHVLEQVHSLKTAQAIGFTLYVNNIQHGVCSCCLNRLGVNIEKKRWVKRNVGTILGYWCERPRNAIMRSHFKFHVIRSLNHRILILNKELERL